MTMTVGQTIRPTPAVPEMRWEARSDDEPWHAFPRVDGLRGLRSLCGLRWTSGWGKAGNRTCPECAAVLRQALAGRVAI